VRSKTAQELAQFNTRDVNETLRSETETFDFKSETRPRPSISGPRPRYFSRPYIQVNCRPYVFSKVTTTMTSSIHALFFTAGTNIKKVIGIIRNSLTTFSAIK